MELEGLSRSVSYLLEHKLSIGTIVTTVTNQLESGLRMHYQEPHIHMMFGMWQKVRIHTVQVAI